MGRERERKEREGERERERERGRERERENEYIYRVCNFDVITYELHANYIYDHPRLSIVYTFPSTHMATTTNKAMICSSGS